MELLSAYTFQGKHNLIFPRARDDTLDELFQKSCPVFFKSLEHTIFAVSGLCSALHAVHEFVTPDFSLRAIGCHHDIKPSNILIENKFLILADFGLSKFKEEDETSKTSFKQVRGDYVAPECADLHNLLRKRFVGRSSDIWSLGCIILEFLVYIHSGPNGVSKFQDRRAYTLDHYTRHRFHHGPGRESPAVSSQIDQLEQSMDESNGPSYRKLALLIRKILSLNPNDRPSASEVNFVIQHLAIEILCKDVQQQYRLLCDRSGSTQVWMGFKRFVGWMQVCGLNEPDILNQWSPKMSQDYKFTQSQLQELRYVLRTLLPDCEQPMTYIYRPLHRLNDGLFAALSPEIQDQAQPISRSFMLDIGTEDLLSNLAVDLAGPKTLNVLARAKFLNGLVDDKAVTICSEFQIDQSCLETPSFLAQDGDCASSYTYGRLHHESSNTKDVIIEAKEYTSNVGSEILVELFQRLSKVTKLLSEAATDFRILPCVGYFHNPSQDCCGLVYEFPLSAIPASQLQITSLKSGLDQHFVKRPLIALGERFKLAMELASSLLKFHEAGWLQKNMSSFNIVFVHAKSVSWFHTMSQPYFLGFVNSRPNEPSAFTTFVENPLEKDYQHPEYLRGRGRVRYRREFDYYSLGLILLEIGRWESIEKMSKGAGSPEQLRTLLRKEKLQRVAHNMGDIYREIVEKCLIDVFAPSENLEHASSSDLDAHLRFSHHVVSQLSKCRV